MKKFLAIAAASAAAFGLGSIANAAVVDCANGTPDVTSFVTGTSACQFSDSENNDSNSAVNSEGFFGFNNWVQDAKDNNVNGVDEGANTYGLEFTGGVQSGTWELTGLTSLPANLDFMLVFKAGNLNNTVPGAIVAYLLTDVMGTYTSPNIATNGQMNPRDISHISLYVRENGNVPDVPLPAAAWLMLAGVAGLSFSSRKKKAA